MAMEFEDALGAVRTLARIIRVTCPSYPPTDAEEPTLQFRSPRFGFDIALGEQRTTVQIFCRNDAVSVCQISFENNEAAEQGQLMDAVADLSALLLLANKDSKWPMQ